jgi:mono/diheme cytochrome c family protein
MKTGHAVLFGILMLSLLAGCGRGPVPAKTAPLQRAYDTQPDWNDPSHVIPLTYQQAQGMRLFYEKCVWCHADSTPAGPSNRSNVTPTPALVNDGTRLNPMSDEYLQNLITLGGSALSKSAMMPPWGKTLKEDEIRALIAYIRAVAQPPYQPTARPQPRYSVR